MTNPVQLPVLPTPPQEYDPKYFTSLLKNLEVYFRAANAAGTIQTSGITVGSNVITISAGAGTPEGVLVASVGSIYLRDNGGVGTTLYVKESGAGNTGWVGK